MRVQVYRNLHTGGWSVRHKGRVISHVDSCALADVSFHVGAAARARVAAGAHRSVHAWAVGELLSSAPAGELVCVTYRPHERDCFYRRDTGARVDGAAYALFGAGMAVIGPR